MPIVAEPKHLVLPACEPNLPPTEVDRRVAAIARVTKESNAALAFYLQEVDQRSIYRRFGYPSAVIYAELRHGVPRWEGGATGDLPTVHATDEMLTAHATGDAPIAHATSEELTARSTSEKHVERSTSENPPSVRPVKPRSTP